MPYVDEIMGEYHGGFRVKISCWPNIYYETNIGKMLGTEYKRTSSIYWLSSSIWHYMEEGNVEWNA